MATKVLPGLITKGVRIIAKPDRPPIILLNRTGRHQLVVTEFGNARSAQISNRVAEILISAGMAYGN